MLNNFLKSIIKDMTIDKKKEAEILNDIKKTLKTFDSDGDLLDLGDDMKDLIRYLIKDSKNALKHLDTVFLIAAKFITSFGAYALTTKKWREIGYWGPRPSGKVFSPPRKILEKEIVMQCSAPVKMPVKEQVGKNCDELTDPFRKSPFHNCEYEKQMEETNILLKDKVKSIDLYPENYEADICIIGTGPV